MMSTAAAPVAGSDSSPQAPPVRMALGVDLGAVTTRVAILDPSKPMPTIVRNELSNEATSTVVSYPADEARCYGENAAAKQVTRPEETVVDLAPWLFGSTDELDVFPTGSGDAAGAAATAAGTGSRKTPALRRIGARDQHPVQLAAFFIKSVLRFVPGDISGYPICLSIPTASSAAATVAVRQACLLAGVPKDGTVVAPSDEAMAAYYHHMHYAALADDAAGSPPPPPPPRVVTILDVGQSCVSACVIAATKRVVTKLAVQSLRMGSGFIDGALCSHVYVEIAKKFGDAALRGDVKSFRRILRECRKAKEILSTVEETHVQLESLQGTMDISIPLSRAHLAELARPFTDALRGMLEALKADIPPTAGEGEEGPLVEVIGGGWRTTFVADMIREVLGSARLGVSLDANLAVAEGSAILAQICSPYAAAAAAFDGAADGIYASHHVTLVNFDVATPGSPTSQSLAPEDEAVIGAWAEVEGAMSAADAAIHARLAAINKLDSFVLQSLQTAEECGASAEQKEAARAYLTAIDAYVQDDCGGDATEAIAARLSAAESHVSDAFPELAEHRARVRAEEQRKEAELEKQRREHQDDEKELKSDPQRLRAAQKRREQGASLFKQEHWQEAQTRFVQALGILGDLYDVSNADTRKARDEIVLSCHLNIASCSVKLGLWRNAINNCTSAMELSPEHPKALFRRGQAYAGSKEYKEAIADLEKAAALSGNDAAVVAELNAARRHYESQKAKEKKMFAKMFS